MSSPDPDTDVVARPWWSSLTSRAVILLTVLALLVATLAMPIREYLQQRATITALQNEYTSGQQRVASLQAQARRWNDPSYLQAQARARLHFVFPGEIGYVVLSPQAIKRARSTKVPTAPVVVSPWYDTLWSSVQQADHGQ